MSDGQAKKLAIARLKKTSELVMAIAEATTSRRMVEWSDWDERWFEAECQALDERLPMRSHAHAVAEGVPQ